jgi:hypothetical protein
MEGFGIRRTLLVLLVVADAATVGFIVAILAGLGSGFALHEIAGLILLVVLLLALWIATRLGPTDRRPLVRVAVALAALILAGTLGAALAGQAIGGTAAGLPLVPLTVVILACSDAIRIVA